MTKTISPFDRYGRADTSVKPRIIGASYGEAGSGKSSFWLGAPGPIVVQTLDQGLEGVVERYADIKEIYVAEYDLGYRPGQQFTHALAVEARDKFVEDFEHAIGCAKTIVWDRESDMWDLFYFAEFGTDDAYGAAPPKDWDKLKGRIRRLIAMAKASDVNFGIIQGVKNEWVQKANPKTGAKAMAVSGKRIRAGMADIEALVHVDLWHERIDGKFLIHVGKSRGAGSQDVQDQVFENVDFKTVAQLIHPESEPEIWE